MTDYHDYNEPDQGAERWHVPLNENFREIDEDIEIRDTEANRSDYEPKEGAKYFETDTGDIYLGDGANWQRQAIASGAETSVSDDGNEVVRDVTDIDLTDGYFDVTNPGGSAVDVSVTDDSIDTDPIDLSITPTWAGLHRFDSGLDTRGDIVADTTTIWDSTNEYVTQSSLENDTVTVDGGNALTGGSVSLGSSVTVDVDTDGVGTDEIDLSITPTWAALHQFDAGIDVRDDLVDDTTTVWDSTNEYVPQTSLENDSVTIQSGNGLKSGGSVSLGGSTALNVEPDGLAGTLLSDDGSDNLQVNEGSIDHDGIDQSTVSADDHHDEDHAVRHGYGNDDELSSALRYEPQAEPSTPNSGCVRWYDQNEDAFKVKFDDGTSVTLAQK